MAISSRSLTVLLVKAFNWCRLVHRVKLGKEMVFRQTRKFITSIAHGETEQKGKEKKGEKYLGKEMVFRQTR